MEKQQNLDHQNDSHQEQDFETKPKTTEDCFNLDLEKLKDTIENCNTNDSQECDDMLESEIGSNKTERIGKLFISLLIVACLVLGKNLMFSFKMNCVNDKILNTLKFANDFINAPDHEAYRNLFQGICSFMVDLTFLATFGYWALFGKNARLPFSLGLFYAIRALIQTIWYSPFPEGYYWFSPGFPSLVVPYGRGSDFFFSGHAGFMMICLEEWHRIGKKTMRNLALVPTIYTVIILFVYRVHYFIDILVGLVFSDMCFWWVDRHIHKLDVIAVSIVEGFKWALSKIHKDEEKKEFKDQEELVVKQI